MRLNKSVISFWRCKIVLRNWDSEYRAQNAKQDKHDRKRHDRHDKDIYDCLPSFMSLSCLSCRLRSCLSCFAFCALYSESQLSKTFSKNIKFVRCLMESLSIIFWEIALISCVISLTEIDILPMPSCGTCFLLFQNITSFEYHTTDS